MNYFRKYVDLFFSILFLLSVVLGYYKDFSHMTEYCFISGLFVGIVFFMSALFQKISGKTLKSYVYFSCVIDIFVIFVATVLVGLNLNGVFRFIHIINPVLIGIYWFIFCKQEKIELKSMMAAVIFPLAYMIFAFIFYKFSGNCPFPASFIFVNRSGIFSILVLLGLSILLCVLGFVFQILNKFLHKKI